MVVIDNSSSLEKREELVRLKLLKIEQLERQRELEKTLPHIYAHDGKNYKWAEEYMASTARKKILTLPNQVSKSSCQIRHFISIATDPSLWKKYWPKLSDGEVPSLWWYLYPDKNTATQEFEHKWMQYLPRGEMKNHHQYGWSESYSHKEIEELSFNTGVKILFKSYGTDVHALQAGSVYMMGLDEEAPCELLPELLMRLEATDGILSAAFTATKGQEFWRKVVQERSEWEDAAVWQQTLYDCQFYSDGTPSPWTIEKIERRKKNLSSEREIQKRVYAQFVVDEGLKFESFERKRNVKPYHPLKGEWQYYAGVDYGSGGASGHPSAIAVVAVNALFTKARLIRCWRGDKIVTTAQTLVDKYVEITRGIPIIEAYYDWAAADVGNIAQSMGLPFRKAEKSHDIGIPMLNSLFGNNGLILYTWTPDCKVIKDHLQTDKLITELETLLSKTNKKHAIDDAVDSLRYSLSKLAGMFDWDKIIEASEEPIHEDGIRPVAQKTELQMQMDKRRDMFKEQQHKSYDGEINDDLEEFNTLLGSSVAEEMDQWDF